MKINLRNWAGKIKPVEIPDDTDKIVGVFISGDMVLIYPFFVDWPDRVTDYLDGTFIVRRENFADFNRDVKREGFTDFSFTTAAEQAKPGRKGTGYPEAFCDWLRVQCYRQGYSLSGVSEACGMSHSWLDMVTTGKRKLSRKSFRTLEATLNLPAGTIARKIKETAEG